jgi:hypothetical protein
MTLKWFHIVFIALSIVLATAVGVWGLFNQFVVLGVVSLAGSAVLCIYAPYFLRKARQL